MLDRYKERERERKMIEIYRDDLETKRVRCIEWDRQIDKIEIDRELYNYKKGNERYIKTKIDIQRNTEREREMYKRRTLLKRERDWALFEIYMKHK